MGNSSSASSSSSSFPTKFDPYENLNRSKIESWKPTPEDIFKVIRLLNKKGNLPNEIIYEIINLSEYWSEDEINFNQKISIKEEDDSNQLFDLNLLTDFDYMKYVFNWFKNLNQIEKEDKIKFNKNDNNNLNKIDLEIENQVQKEKLIAKVMKIEWNVVSHDQGWSSYPEDHGTYRNSWTWTEATLYDRSRSTPRLPSNHSSWYRIATNIHARRKPTLHQSTWYPDHPFLLDLNQKLYQFTQLSNSDHSIGFVVAAVAKYNGWENTIESLKCSIFYSFT